MNQRIAFALCALSCVPAALLAQTTIEHTTPGNLESTMPLECVSLDKVTPEHTPADLFAGVWECVQQGDSATAIDLYFMAASYARYDIARVSDVSAHQAVNVLQAQLGQAMNKDEHAAWSAEMEARQNNGDKSQQAFCQSLRQIGAPTYYPHYMIQHGLDATIPWSDPAIKPEFDPRAGWLEALSFADCATADELAEMAALEAEKKDQFEDMLRATVAAGLEQAMVVQQRVESVFNTTKTLPNNNAQAGIDKPDPNAFPPFKLSVGQSGIISIEYSDPYELFQKTVVLTPILDDNNDLLGWSCTSTSLESTYLPSTCESTVGENTGDSSAPQPQPEPESQAQSQSGYQAPPGAGPQTDPQPASPAAPIASAASLPTYVCTLEGEWTDYNDDLIRPHTLAGQWIPVDDTWMVTATFTDVDGDTQIDGVCTTEVCAFTQLYTEGEYAGTTFDMALGVEITQPQDSATMNLAGYWGQGDKPMGELWATGQCILID